MRVVPSLATRTLPAIALCLAACGGGGGDNGGGTPTPTQNPPEYVWIGARINNSGLLQTLGTMQPAPGTFFMGEAINEGRLFLTFLIGTPQDEQLLTARIRIPVVDRLDDPTAPPLNGYIAQRVDIGPSLDDFDLDAPTLGPSSPAGPASPPGLADGGAFYLDVTQSLQEAIDQGVTSVTYRIRLAGLSPTFSDPDGNPDGFMVTVGDVTKPALNPTLEMTVVR